MPKKKSYKGKQILQWCEGLMNSKCYTQVSICFAHVLQNQTSRRNLSCIQQMTYYDVKARILQLKKKQACLEFPVGV